MDTFIPRNNAGMLKYSVSDGWILSITRKLCKEYLENRSQKVRSRYLQNLHDNYIIIINQFTTHALWQFNNNQQIS